jgi:hypothetical protein
MVGHYFRQLRVAKHVDSGSRHEWPLTPNPPPLGPLFPKPPSHPSPTTIIFPMSTNNSLSTDSKYDQYDFPTTAPESQSGHSGHTTPEQDAKMHQLRAELEKLGYTERLDSLTLLRFLRARKFDVEAAKTMYVPQTLQVLSFYGYPTAGKTLFSCFCHWALRFANLVCIIGLRTVRRGARNSVLMISLVPLNTPRRRRSSNTTPSTTTKLIWWAKFFFT